MDRRVWWGVFGVAVVGLVGAGLYEAHAAGAAVAPAGPAGASGPAPTYSAQPAAQALAAAIATGCSAANLAALCTAFQNASNSDPGAVARVGSLSVNGQFDQSTAAALAWYGQGAFLPCPNTAATPPASGTNPGSAASTAYLLSAYLLAHGCDGSSTLTTLCSNFQTAENEDTSGLGPASAKPVLNALIRTDGVFDSTTSQALALYTGTAAMTPCSTDTTTAQPAQAGS
jgi:hypothetical protein